MTPLPYIGPLTGVRIHDTFWLCQARKADVILMNRGPIPAPAWTYDGTLRGNWSYIDCLHLNGSAAVDFTSSRRTCPNFECRPPRRSHEISVGTTLDAQDYSRRPRYPTKA
ncbi:uncharacterized protein BT62DRAFT_928496 [Guyanagaster necrorhizus]|uniref:Uncharacterized protein n=1 Tax=Guyanagaster necrorhizus TaxID=856835 RepID=A0A9P7VZD7_9AGAR|nr:uncharacterized protein BT62DRAFT_928496 [Guyanagaster necrorhizus MCA 3950]KAG7449762.1 hypothetical protein BT62DRAFT_928496 [Guyanagaster necrorhizus MCA 3950]